MEQQRNNKQLPRILMIPMVTQLSSQLARTEIGVRIHDVQTICLRPKSPKELISRNQNQLLLLSNVLRESLFPTVSLAPVISWLLTDSNSRHPSKTSSITSLTMMMKNQPQLSLWLVWAIKDLAATRTNPRHSRYNQRSRSQLPLRNCSKLMMMTKTIIKIRNKTVALDLASLNPSQVSLISWIQMTMMKILSFLLRNLRHRIYLILLQIVKNQLRLPSQSRLPPSWTMTRMTKQVSLSRRNL